MTTTESRVLDAERTELLAELRTVRAALLATVAGLSDEQIAASPSASELCLGGLVKHVANTEEKWLEFAVRGTSAMSFDLPEGVTWADIEAGTATEWPAWIVERQAEFRVLPGETLAGILARYEEVAAKTEEVVASLPDLSVIHPLPDAPWNEPGQSMSLRRVLLHVISETAQHAGHADIVRETLDGQKAT